ncbi:MAG: UDP-glucose 4-epimerase GalE [Bacilli bacterium]|nr:UDP-glucose 4-epimerase GalE [Bacilli bacterium]
MNILVTGGTGYIGSHTVVELLNEGHDVVIVDNFFNSKPDVLDKIKAITGKDVKFYEVDCCDEEKMETIFKENKIDGAIHFAGYKAVGESVAKPIIYYENNILSTLVLCKLLKKYDCKKLIFSSSATVYGDPHTVPIKEDFPLGPTTNPYGSTKLMIENILKDVYISDCEWNIVLLRYFNPIGAHSSYLLGENPKGIPNNLMPYINKVAVGELECLGVFGDDYDTHDGTGVRDFIHVVDLAKGHVKALKKLTDDSDVYVYNLGTGNGFSVLDLVKTYEKVNNLKLNYVIKDRRPGDIAACYADSSKAKEELGWEASKTIEDMCRDSYQYMIRNS